MAKKEFYRYLNPSGDGKPTQTIEKVLEDITAQLVDALQFIPNVLEYRGDKRKKLRITVKVETV